MDRRARYMMAAMEEAKTALSCGDVPVGAVVVCDGEIIARAHNERECAQDPTAHAEVLALRRAAQQLGRRRLSGCSLYVTLEPCPMCAGALVMAGVDEVFFGAYDSRCGCAGSVYALTEDPAFGGGIPAYGGLMQEECIKQLRGFFDERREEAAR